MLCNDMETFVDETPEAAKLMLGAIKTLKLAMELVNPPTMFVTTTR
jgi:hypothetical protein